MSRIFLLITLCISISLLHAQNLVPNPSFEDTLSSIPCSWATIGQLNSISSEWTVPNNSSPDIRSANLPANCWSSSYPTVANRSGAQTPRLGSKTAGLVAAWRPTTNPNRREYIQTQLDSNLIVGADYIVSMYLSLGENSSYITNKFGVFFSSGAIAYPLVQTNIPLTPQVEYNTYVVDDVNWVLVQDTFTATVAFDHLTIGNFANDANSNLINIGGSYIGTYYFIEDVTVQEISTILPVTFSKINAIALNGSIQINWATATEIDANKFIVQHSIDGSNWNSIGEVNASGNSQTTVNYRFVHDNSTSGINYYRLKQVDFNDAFEFSKIVSVNTTSTINLVIDVKVNANQLAITNLESDLNSEISIFSIGGKLIASNNLTLNNNETQNLELNGLSGGIYFVKIKCASGMITRKFVKN